MIRVEASCIHLWDVGCNSRVCVELPDGVNVNNVEIGTPVICHGCTHVCIGVKVVDHLAYIPPFINPDKALILTDGEVKECDEPVFRTREDREL